MITLVDFVRSLGVPVRPYQARLLDAIETGGMPPLGYDAMQRAQREELARWMNAWTNTFHNER